MFSKPKEKPEPPKVYVLTFEDHPEKAFLNLCDAQQACADANGLDPEGEEQFGPYDIVEIEVYADGPEWRKRCPVCQARETFYKKTEDDLK